MSHTVIIITKSLLEVFDPDEPDYAGLRSHYTASQLARIDELRARPETASFTFEEKLFICWALDKAVMLAENP